MLRLLHVLGQIDHHRTGTPAAGDIERFLDDARDVLDVLDQEIVLGARASDADEVRLLESIVANIVVGTWPDKTTIGVESMYASAIPVTVLVAPGPEVTMTTPGRPLTRA